MSVHRKLGLIRGRGMLHGLKPVAVAIVAQAVWGMTRTLWPDRRRIGIACAAAARPVIVVIPGAVGGIALAA